ncbi:recombinase family protein [Streptomyces collinus]|uniref:Phague integrase n=1 Tax=Streptomyces collinus (strain DSM 40733 / Tue 365) TaxID=1214242 RepID=S5UWE0_STRC3|nr:recombinase family protein [Streptomyces collinus]AGS71533.1 phague integrase [Streptomyces collinus Tu 365]UJA10181.1 phage integrase [Streptomyces collinus]UJA14955.1 phage integrase [Streptomyces collinus]
MIKHPRVLGTVRLSILKDDTTSPEKQRHAVEHWASGPAVDGRMVGFAEDLDVSGALHPFKRPGLGPWFLERADDWDVLAVWKLDRLSRKAGHFAEVLEWCQKRGKTIVSVTEGIDMGTPMGKMFAQIIAAFAEGELDTIRARALSGSRARKAKGVWIGGVEPFGYRFERQECGGKKLAQDPDYGALFQEIVERLKGDWSSYKIAVDLNKRGVPTWRDHLRIVKGEKPRGIEWTSNAVRVVVMNPTVAGIYTYKGENVVDENGEHVSITDQPLMDYAEWAGLVASLKSDRPVRRATPSRSMLGGVAVCLECGSRMSSNKKTKPDGRVHHYYGCNAVNTGTCDKPGRIRRDDLDQAVGVFVETVLGPLPVMERVGNAISQTKVELAEAEEVLDRLEADYLAGRFKTDVQVERYWGQHEFQSAKVERLRAEIKAAEDAPGWITTGRTNAEEWAAKDDEQKRVFLRRHGITVHVGPTEDGNRRVVVKMPEVAEIPEAVGLHAPEGYRRVEREAEYILPRQRAYKRK